MPDQSHWERGYSVGNWMLDNQHRNILTLCQQTIDRIAHYGQFQSLCDELVACTEDHFTAEEHVLQAMAYPSLDRHGDEHRRCLAALKRMLGDTSRGKVVPQDLGEFLSVWCMGHILVSDRKFAPVLQRVR